MSEARVRFEHGPWRLLTDGTIQSQKFNYSGPPEWVFYGHASSLFAGAIAHVEAQLAEREKERDALREYVDWQHLMLNQPVEFPENWAAFLDRGTALRSRIGRDEHGNWIEREGK